MWFYDAPVSPYRIPERHSKTKGKNASGKSYVVAIGLIDNDGATVVVPVQIDYLAKDGSDAVVDIVTSAYGITLKENRSVPDDNWFKNAIEGKDEKGIDIKAGDKEYELLYLNKQKSTNWFRGSPSERGADPKTNSALLNAILSVDETKVKTEKDLRFYDAPVSPYRIPENKS